MGIVFRECGHAKPIVDVLIVLEDLEPSGESVKTWRRRVSLLCTSQGRDDWAWGHVRAETLLWSGTVYEICADVA